MIYGYENQIQVLKKNKVEQLNEKKLITFNYEKRFQISKKNKRILILKILIIYLFLNLIYK